jgi:hypothetical protein
MNGILRNQFFTARKADFPSSAFADPDHKLTVGSYLTKKTDQTTVFKQLICT